MMNIVILDSFAANPGDLSWQPLSAIGELTVYDFTRPDELLERAKNADILITNKVLIKAEHLQLLPRVRYIGILATGYNNVDIEAARQRGIIVTNIPAYSTDSVAQLVFAHLLNVTNHVDHYAHESRAGVWSKQQGFCYWNTPLLELTGKAIGIVGLGNIGLRVANIAHTFGMDVFASTRKSSKELPSFIQKTTFQGLLTTSDVLTLHCPLTDNTYHLMNADTLSLMKHGAILINTGRGPLVNDQDVANALKSGQLTAYCADVLSEEPPSMDNPLLHCHNAYITPHVAWATFEARSRLVDIAIDNVRSFIEGHRQHVVNAI